MGIVMRAWARQRLANVLFVSFSRPTKRFVCFLCQKKKLGQMGMLSKTWLRVCREICKDVVKVFLSIQTSMDAHYVL